MLKICFSFDYELFLGGNKHSYYDVLISPTNRIIDIMCKHDVRGTFFIDTCSLLAHSNHGLNDYVADVTDQIKRLVLTKNDPQLHIHSNWYNAILSNGGLIPSKEKYRIQDFGFEDNPINAFSIIKKNISFLNETCRSVDNNYKCIAFRAGGFAIQPEKELINALLKNGIRIDSSVLPFMHSDGINNYDFRKIPNKLNWLLDDVNGIACDSDSVNSIYEIPIMTIRPNIKYYLKRRTYRHLPSTVFKGEFISANNKQNKKNSKIKKILNLFAFNYPSLDSRPYLSIYDDLIRTYKRYNLSKQTGYVCLICHPKLMDDARLNNFENLIKILKKDDKKFQIMTIFEMFNEIKNGGKNNG